MSIYLATFGKLRYLGLADIAEDAVPRTTRWVLIRTARGLEMGLIGGPLSPEQEAKYRASCLEDRSGEQMRGPEPMLQEVEYLGGAGAEQIEEYYRCRDSEGQTLLRAREILLDHDLQMKLVDVEYLLDRKKLFFYFTAEQRVDFRAYVRDLAREFRTRIEMRQIGVRDEARVVEGIAPCGRPCCCSYWLHHFSPIGIRMVKEQKLALNPAKISGICGRLMCCMAYEHPTYNELWKTLPGPGTKIRTEHGNYVLEGVDLATEHVQVRFPSGRIVPVSIPEFPDFRDAVLRGEPWGEEEDPSPRPVPTPRHHPREQGEGRESERNGVRALPRHNVQEKVTLEEHLAMRERQVLDQTHEGSPGQGRSRRGDRRQTARPPQDQGYAQSQRPPQRQRPNRRPDGGGQHYPRQRGGRPGRRGPSGQGSSGS